MPTQPKHFFVIWCCASLLILAGIAGTFYVGPELAVTFVKERIFPFAQTLYAVWGAVGAGTIVTALWDWRRKKKRQAAELDAWAAYFQNPRQAAFPVSDASAVVSEKKRYYGLRFRDPRSSIDALERYRLGIPAQWDVHDRVFETASALPTKAKAHIHISSPPREGRSTTLAAVAHRLSLEPSTHVLWLHGERSLLTDEEIFEPVLALGYARRLWQRNSHLRVFGTRPKLVLCIDDFRSHEDEYRLQKRKADFLDAIARDRSSVSGICVITTGSEDDPPVAAEVVEPVRMSAEDQKRVLARIGHQEPVIASGVPEEPSEVWNATGVSTEERSSVQAFLAALGEYNSDFRASRVRLPLDTAPTITEALKLVAATGLLGIPFPAGRLELALNRMDRPLALDQLEAMPDPPIRRATPEELAEFGFEGEGILFDSRLKARAFLQDYGADSQDKLLQLYSDATKVALEEIHGTAAPEFARYLLQRLGRQRRFGLRGVRPRSIAVAIFHKEHEKIGLLMSRLDTEQADDLGQLCAWAGALSGMRTEREGLLHPHLVSNVCSRIANRQGEAPLPGRAISSYCRALRALNVRGERTASRRTLLHRAMHGIEPRSLEFDLKSEDAPRRINQVYHAYWQCKKLDIETHKSARSKAREDALNALIQEIEDTHADIFQPFGIPLDSRCWILKGDCQRQNGIGSAEESYLAAIDAANSDKHAEPASIVDAHLRIFRYVTESRGYDARAIRRYERFLDRMSRWHVEYGRQVRAVEEYLAALLKHEALTARRIRAMHPVFCRMLLLDPLSNRIDTDLLEGLVASLLSTRTRRTPRLNSILQREILELAAFAREKGSFDSSFPKAAKELEGMLMEKGEASLARKLAAVFDSTPAAVA